MEEDDHIQTEQVDDKIIQEHETIEQFEFTLEKDTLTNEVGNIALENEVGNLTNEVQNTDIGDITDIRLIASGGGYTTLPTSTITVGDRHIGQETDTALQRLGLIALEGSEPETSQIQLVYMMHSLGL